MEAAILESGTSDNTLKKAKDTITEPGTSKKIIKTEASDDKTAYSAVHTHEERASRRSDTDVTETQRSVRMAKEGMPSTIFRQPLPFDLADTQNRGARWQKWIRRFENYMEATCGEPSDAPARRLLLNLVGDEVEDLLVTFPPENKDSYKELVKSLAKNFDPQRNVVYERYTFNST